MNCTIIESKALQYLEGDLDRSELEALERHLAECGSCKEYLSFLKSTMEVFEEERVIDDNPAFISSVFEEIDGGSSHIQLRRRILSYVAAAAIFFFAVFTGMNIGKLTSSAYSAETSIGETDILFASEISMEPIESFFFSTDNE